MRGPERVIPAWMDKPMILEKARVVLVSNQAVADRALREVPNQVLELERATQQSEVTKVGRPLDDAKFRNALARWPEIWSDLIKRF